MNNISRKDVMIQQLANRAGQGNPYHIPPEFVVEFAEHIISECVGVILTKERHRAEYFARVVQRHFGLLDDGDDDE